LRPLVRLRKADVASFIVWYPFAGLVIMCLKMASDTAQLGDNVSFADLFAGGHASTVPDGQEGGFPDGLRLTSLVDANHVSKKWGYELWFLHDQAPFACKGIFLKKGFRTSLQYHVEKEELNLVMSGQARLFFQDRRSGKVESVEVSAGTAIHVRANTVHRI